MKTKDDFLQEIDKLLESLNIVDIVDNDNSKQFRNSCAKLIREIIDSHFSGNANDLWQRKCLCRAIKMLEINFLEACLHKLQNACASSSPNLAKEEKMIRRVTKEELVERLEKAIYIAAQR